MAAETGFGPGAYGASAAEAPGVPAYEGHGSGTIDISFTTGENAAEVQYELRATYAGPAVRYVQADGTLGAGEVWRTAAQWGAMVTVSGLTDFVGYTFAARARNEMEAVTVWTAESANMNTLPVIDYGLTSDNLEREITPGKVKVGDIVIGGNEAPGITPVGYYGTVTLTFDLSSYAEDDADIEAQYSEDSGGTWAAATLVGDVTDLPTLEAGKSTVTGWDSYSDAGKSEYQIDARVRVRARDEANNWSDWVESEDFTVYNLPGKIVWEWEDEQEWGEATTPAAIAVIPGLNGGDRGFPEITLYEGDGTTLIETYKSVVDVTGWEYESTPDTWVALTSAGIPEAAIDGINRVRFTPPDALDTIDIILTGRMGEVRDLG